MPRIPGTFCTVHCLMSYKVIKTLASGRGARSRKLPVLSLLDPHFGVAAIPAFKNEDLGCIGQSRIPESHDRSPRSAARTRDVWAAQDVVPKKLYIPKRGWRSISACYHILRGIHRAIGILGEAYVIPAKIRIAEPRQDIL